MENDNFFAVDPADKEFGKAENDTTQADQQADNGNDNDSDSERNQRKNHDARRWERLMKERQQDRELISELARFKEEVEAGQFNNNQYGERVPEHFKKMYEDGLTLEERWAMQREYDQRREQEIIERAEQAALQRINQQKEEEEKWEGYIDDQLEFLEEKYNIDLTSGSSKAERLKTDFLKTVRRVSPKDENGEIISLPSFEDTFELWSNGKSMKSSGGNNVIERKKDIASMSGDSRPVQQPQTIEAGEGGMWGWKKDIPSNNR